MDRPQLDWLNKNLHLAPRRRAFIFLHHPLDAPALRDMRYTLLQNNRELLAILHGHNIGGSLLVTCILTPTTWLIVSCQ
ncbi:hypothetical protein L3X07_02275 [Levilactobacillus brevis]|nr:hypothetical protein [Levilactobacillus brevis]